MSREYRINRADVEAAALTALYLWCVEKGLEGPAELLINRAASITDVDVAEVHLDRKMLSLALEGRVHEGAEYMKVANQASQIWWQTIVMGDL